MSKASVDFKWDQGAVNAVEAAFNRGMVRMGYSVANRARALAPYKSGALRNSIRVTEEGSDVYVAAGGNFGGKTIAYARIQELGGYAGRNHSVYIKPREYLRGGFESVLREDWSQYFKGVI